ncbi:hypothetical protein G6F23_013568 [Rhizopus arrhizus]|nr:hypothetical protein G6F23_013568 [Rhizopus arrhizus]
MTQGSLTMAVAGGLVMYTAGVQPSGESPNQERGIALHAAQGKVSARAHKNQLIVAAQTKVRIASTEADVQLSAPSTHLLATAAGAYIRIEGDNIELGAPGKVEFKASQRDWVGPASVGGEAKMPTGTHKACEFRVRAAEKSGAGLVPLGG